MNMGKAWIHSTFPAMDKQKGILSSLVFVKQPVSKENSESYSALLC